MIGDLTEQGLMWVLTHLRKADEREVRATVWQGDVATTAERIAGVRNMIGFEARLAQTFEPAAVGGVVPVWPGLCSVWLFATDKFPSVGREVTRFIGKTLLPQLEQANMGRVECRPMCGNDEVVRWLRLLGFEVEARMARFGQHGESFYLMARTFAAGKSWEESSGGFGGRGPPH